MFYLYTRKTHKRAFIYKNNSKKRMKTSLIISTYNSPDMLRLSLMSVKQQTRMPYEVIVADDGSTDETRQLIAHMTNDFPCTLKHAWQEDRGFRLAESRNNALRMCEGDYVVFVDGDIIMERHFIEDHERMARKGHFVAGSRSKLSPSASKRLIKRHQIGIHWYSRGVRSRLNAFYMPWLAFYTRNLYRKEWDKGRGANIAMFRSDIKKVNGFNADMVGYGLEDTDIIVRLVNLGLKRTWAKFRAIEFHLYHKEKPFARDNRPLLEKNQYRVRCDNGIVSCTGI